MWICRKIIQAWSDELYTTFITVVASEREVGHELGDRKTKEATILFLNFLKMTKYEYKINYWWGIHTCMLFHNCLSFSKLFF